MWIDEARRTRVFENVDRDVFETEVVPLQQPAILKGFVADWPAVIHGRSSSRALCDYLKGFATPRPVQAWFGKPDMGGRFGYGDDLKGLNHEQKLLPFSALTDLLMRLPGESDPPHIYAGAVPIPQIMPELAADNPMPLLEPAQDRLTSLWIGSRTRTAAHWDLPQNLACVIAGRRRFTMLPINQINNLYVGPIDFTPAGQPISLVDFIEPDFARFPRFREAMPYAEVAELEAGDVLYMPSLWFHHVESLEGFGAMVNFWWRAGPDYLTTPMLTLYHALLTLHDMPLHERMRWKSLFDHYIFPADEDPMAHIPADARGVFGEKTVDVRARLRAYLARSLGQ